MGMLDGGSRKRVDYISGMQGVDVVVTHWKSVPLACRMRLGARNSSQRHIS